MSEGVLAPYRVLDLTDGPALIGGKNLADLGAEVIKIEGRDGDQARRTPPYAGNEPDPERSLLCFAYNQGKKGITLELRQEKGKKLLKALAARADILLESFDPGHLDSIGLGYEALSAINPRLVVTSISAFGQTGPYRDFKQSDLVVMALSGYLSLLGDPDRAPVRISHPISFYLAGIEAAASSLVALHYRNRTGQGQHVDVSAQQVLALFTANAPPFWEMKKRLIIRSGQNRGEITTSVKSPQLWRCKDGWISFAIYGGQIGARSNVPLIAWMDGESMADDWLKAVDWQRLDMAALPAEFFHEVQKRLESFFVKYTKAELFQGAIQRGMILYPVYTMSEVLQDPQLHERGFWVEIEHPELGSRIKYPGAFTKTSLTPVGTRRRAPWLGEHNWEVYSGLLGLSKAELDELKTEGVI